MFIFSSANSQIAHDLTIYSEDEIKFSLVLNGKKRTEEFTTNVELKNLQQESVKVVVEFEDTTIPGIEKNLYLAKAGTGEKPPMSSVYVIKKNKKGEVKLRLVSQAEKMIQTSPTIIIKNNH
jgi:L-2-hydroxyglutarate oxidase LhgO